MPGVAIHTERCHYLMQAGAWMGALGRSHSFMRAGKHHLDERAWAWLSQPSIHTAVCWLNVY